MTEEIRFEIELREDDSRLSPGRIVGQLLRYNERARDRAELFETGALSWPTDGIVLNRQHERGSPILRFEPIIDGSEIRINESLPDTKAGRDAATEIRSGLMRGLSIEFKAIRERMVSGVRRISKALLTGAGLVDSPSYRTAVELRSKRRRVWL